MAKVKIVVIDADSGQTVKSMVRELSGYNATEAAEEIREAVDEYTNAENVDGED